MKRQVLLTLVVLGVSGCVVETNDSGPTEHEKKTVPMDKSEALRVDLRMGAGDLKVRGGGSQLVDADFTYNRPSLKPEFRYDPGSFRGHLTIEEPSSRGHNIGHNNYEWDLQLNDTVPVSLSMQFGAGVADLKLGSLSLDSVELNMGVGKVEMDLRGSPKKDYDVRIHGGVGEATVYLPHDVAVVADAHGGLGSIETQGLHKQGSRYVNDTYENHGKVTVRLTVQGGIGSIHLIGE